MITDSDEGSDTAKPLQSLNDNKGANIDTQWYSEGDLFRRAKNCALLWTSGLC